MRSSLGYIRRILWPKDDHICVFNYNVIVGKEDFGYNNIVDSFCTNCVGFFARIIKVNLSILVCLDLYFLLLVLMHRR